MNKTNTHENTFCIPAMRRHLNNSGGQQETYTKKEQELFKILSKANGQDLFSISIRTIISRGKLGCIKEVIEMLKQQYQDCGRERMIEVLGVDAVKLLETIS